MYVAQEAYPEGAVSVLEVHPHFLLHFQLMKLRSFAKQTDVVVTL
jgi:hypothetical protein